MKSLPISITAISSTDQQGWVVAQMIDADGVQHDFEEKIPVVTEEDFWDDTPFPRQGSIACEVISTWIANDGRALSKIDTSIPWGIESKTGATEFVVLSDSLQSIA
jgi:hypothetical protein